MNIAAFSSDGTFLICHNFTWNTGHCIIGYKWDTEQEEYIEQWRTPFAPRGWLIGANLRTLEISDDGSTVLVAVQGNGTEPPLLETKTVMIDTATGQILWVYNTKGQGKYADMPWDLRLSSNGSRAIVGYWEDEDQTIDELKIFTRTSLILYFSFDAPGSMFSVDITNDGKFACATCHTVHASIYPYESIVYGIDTTKAALKIDVQIRGGLGIHVHIVNTGNDTITDWPWTINVTGGMFNRISKESSGVLTSLSKGQTKNIRSKIFFGIGSVYVKITVDFRVYKENGKIFGPFFLTLYEREIPML